MKRTSSIRKTGGVRRTLAGGPDGTSALNDFEEVSLDAVREHRPSFRRSGTASSAGSTGALNLTGRLPLLKVGSHLNHRSNTNGSVDSLPETLARSTTEPVQLQSGRHASTSSLPLASDNAPYARRMKRSTSQFWLQRQMARTASHSYSSDESIPEDLELGNIPLSPALADETPEEEDVLTKASRLTSSQDVYLAALNSDTQRLTADLSAHVGQLNLQEVRQPVQFDLHITHKTKAERKASAKAAVSQLHPMLDKRIETLPISREKEAHLTCTRPTFLPPKSKREEKKHLKEYERLLRGSLESEHKVQRKKYKQVNNKAKHLVNSVEQWDKSILPHFATAIRDPRTRVLWWSGLPSRVRGRVWSTCIGNALSVTPETFRVAFEKSKLLEEQVMRPSTPSSTTQSQLLTTDQFVSLRHAVNATFSDLRIFQPGGPLHDSLLQVLMAYLYYRQDVGFVAGASYIAALLLLNMTPEQSFIALVNLLNRALPLALYTRDEAVLNRFLATFSKHFQEKLPKLHRHLQHDLQLPPTRYLLPMLYSLFAERAPVDVTSRLWDIYFFEGDLFLMRAALGIMVQLEHALYGTAEEVLSVLAGQGKEADTWRRNLQSEDGFIEVVQSVWR